MIALTSRSRKSAKQGRHQEAAPATENSFLRTITPLILASCRKPRGWQHILFVVFLVDGPCLCWRMARFVLCLAGIALCSERFLSAIHMRVDGAVTSFTASTATGLSKALPGGTESPLKSQHLTTAHTMPASCCDEANSLKNAGEVI